MKYLLRNRPLPPPQKKFIKKKKTKSQRFFLYQLIRIFLLATHSRHVWYPRSQAGRNKITSFAEYVFIVIFSLPTQITRLAYFSRGFFFNFLSNSNIKSLERNSTFPRMRQIPSVDLLNQNKFFFLSICITFRSIHKSVHIYQD